MLLNAVFVFFWEPCRTQATANRIVNRLILLTWQGSRCKIKNTPNFGVVIINASLKATVEMSAQKWEKRVMKMIFSTARQSKSSSSSVLLCFGVQGWAPCVLLLFELSDTLELDLLIPSPLESSRSPSRSSNGSESSNMTKSACESKNCCKCLIAAVSMSRLGRMPMKWSSSGWKDEGANTRVEKVGLPPERQVN